LTEAKQAAEEESEEAGRKAHAAFKHAIDIAASQGAKTLELRARVARARHCAKQGKGQKAFPRTDL